MENEAASHERELVVPSVAPHVAPTPAVGGSLGGFAAGMGNAAFASGYAGAAPGAGRGVARSAVPSVRIGSPTLARAVVAREAPGHTCTCGGTGASCTCGGHGHDEAQERTAGGATDDALLRAVLARRIAREPTAAPAPSATPSDASAPPPVAPAPAVPAPGATDAGGGTGAPATAEPNQSVGPGAPPAGVDVSPGAPVSSEPGGLPAGFVLIPTQDPAIACKPGTPGLNFDLNEALGAAGPLGEHMPAPVPKITDVPHPTLQPLKLLDPLAPPLPTNPNEKFAHDAGALLSLSMAIKEANARGPQINGVAGISNDQLKALQTEVGKAETHAKKATEAQSALKRDAAAIRTLPAVRAAATAYQDKYRAFEKTVRDTQPKVHGLKQAAADLAAVQAAAGAKKETAEADKKQAEVDKVKKQAETVLNIGTKAIEGFKSGGWMGAAAGAAGGVNDAAKDVVGAEIKSLASGMIVKLLKPDIEQTEAAITAARAKAARLTDESEAKALEAKFEGYSKAATELTNAQKDVEGAGKALLEAEGGFASALKSAGLTGAIKAIAMRREMRMLHGTAMQAVNTYGDGLTQNETLIADAVALYTHVLNMACNAQKLADVSATMGTASLNLGAVKQFRGWGKREVGAVAVDRTKLGEWLAGYDVLADELTAILSAIPK